MLHFFFFFFFNDTATTEIYTLSLHDALPIFDRHFQFAELEARLYRSRDLYESALAEYDEACTRHDAEMEGICAAFMAKWGKRSEEHTSELQSRLHLVCRLLLEKKKKTQKI